MRLECVVVCRDYGDFLSHTLPLNKCHFDRMVVVISETDVATQKLCEFWHVECIPTTVLNPNGEFHKGSAINVGLAALDPQGWVVHLDADILLPPTFRGLLERGHLDPKMIFGCDRFMVPSYAAWEAFQSHPKLQHEAGVYVHPSAFALGTRIAPDDKGGALPIGFFQLWCPKRSGHELYPEQHTTAGRGDMLFASQWPRAERGFLPEVIVYHLESEPVAMGANWSGRTSKTFGPEQEVEDIALLEGIPEPVAVAVDAVDDYSPASLPAKWPWWGVLIYTATLLGLLGATIAAGYLR